MYLIEQRHVLHPPKTLNLPQVYNLITDPKEEFDLVPQEFAASWVFPPVFGKIAVFQQSLVQEPPLPFGAPEPWEPWN